MSTYTQQETVNEMFRHLLHTRTLHTPERMSHLEHISLGTLQCWVATCGKWRLSARFCSRQHWQDGVGDGGRRRLLECGQRGLLDCAKYLSYLMRKTYFDFRLYWNTVDTQYYDSFQVYDIEIWHLYPLDNEHHDKSSNYLSWYKVKCKIIDCIPCAVHYIPMTFIS